jgi:signal recognition particle receptor subunit beta
MYSCDKLKSRFEFMRKMMKKILVIASLGAWKSTFIKSLSKSVGEKTYHIDRL